MSVVAMKSQCMKTIMTHLIDMQTKAISYYQITRHVANLCSDSS